MTDPNDGRHYLVSTEAMSDMKTRIDQLERDLKAADAERAGHKRAVRLAVSRADQAEAELAEQAKELAEAQAACQEATGLLRLMREHNPDMTFPPADALKVREYWDAEDAKDDAEEPDPCGYCGSYECSGSCQL